MAIEQCARAGTSYRSMTYSRCYCSPGETIRTRAGVANIFRGATKSEHFYLLKRAGGARSVAAFAAPFEGRVTRPATLVPTGSRLFRCRFSRRHPRTPQHPAQECSEPGRTPECRSNIGTNSLDRIDGKFSPSLSTLDRIRSAPHRDTRSSPARPIASRRFLFCALRAAAPQLAFSSRAHPPRWTAARSRHHHPSARILCSKQQRRPARAVDRRADRRTPDSTIRARLSSAPLQRARPGDLLR